MNMLMIPRIPIRARSTPNINDLPDYSDEESDLYIILTDSDDDDVDDDHVCCNMTARRGCCRRDFVHIPIVNICQDAPPYLTHRNVCFVVVVVIAATFIVTLLRHYSAGQLNRRWG